MNDKYDRILDTLENLREDVHKLDIQFAKTDYITNEMSDKLKSVQLEIDEIAKKIHPLEENFNNFNKFTRMIGLITAVFSFLYSAIRFFAHT